MARGRMKVAIVGGVVGFVVLFAWAARVPVVEGSAGLADNRKKARAAFGEAVKVFLSPRCTNCHPAGDSPLQGDESTLHVPEVMRGPQGHGTEELQCNMCHVEKNTDGEHMPPGVPDWHMPAGAERMTFQGLTAGQICRNIKDPAKNGGKKSPKETIEHLATDPKVLWAWAPGTGRSVPPMTHQDFIKKMNEWVANGAACPE